MMHYFVSDESNKNYCIRDFVLMSKMEVVNHICSFLLEKKEETMLISIVITNLNCNNLEKLYIPAEISLSFNP